MLLKYFSILALLVATTTTAVAETNSAVTWQTDLDAARAMAERDQKLLLVHFYSDNCGPCAMLDATVFTQPTVAGAIHSHYIPVKLNTNDYPATAERFGITRVPCDVMITPQGQLIERKVSPASPLEFVKQITGVAEQHRNKLASSFAKSTQGQVNSQPLNPAYGSIPSPGDINAYTQTSVAANGGLTTNPHIQTTLPTPAEVPMTQQGLPNIQVPPIAMSNPYTGQQVAAAQPQVAAQVPTQPQVPAQAQVQVQPQVQPQAQPTQVAMNLPPITPAQPAVPTTPPTAAPVAPQPTTVASAPQLPANSPPLGLFGYDPVTLKKHGAWQKGDARWGCYHRGRTYLFSSEEARDQFRANGDLYAPALSGIDPVAALDTGKVQQGNPDFCLECGGQLYLFSSEENLNKFSSQTTRYVDGIRQAMNSAPTGRSVY